MKQVAECASCSFRSQPKYLTQTERVAVVGYFGGLSLMVVGLLLVSAGVNARIVAEEPIGFTIAGVGGLSVLLSKLLFGISYLKTPKPK